jgi:UDP-N-acetylglucosamine--N-acetylmuramyl-(pentapeptide) pyrophosphoryl-undecaprenol N-acetylglucosamine transferase
MGKTIILTGGGTAGHVTPNLALIPLLQRDGWTIHYIGSHQGIERELLAAFPQVAYHAISSGKLRRYIDLKNITDPFRVLAGAFQARKIIGRIKPQIIFSKGGFVSVPVVWAGSRAHVPVVIHESDITPGLANKLAIPMCRRVCTTFPEAAAAVGEKGLCTGSPIRPSLYDGSRERGLAFAGLTGKRPVLLIMGGSLGAQAINQAVDAALDRLLDRYEIIHLRGKGALNPALEHHAGYTQYEYVKEQLSDLLAAADLILSRAGANAIWEFAALHKPMLLIPLPLSASRGDQILNAKSFVKLGYAQLLEQENLTAQTLTDALATLWANRGSLIAAQKAGDTRGGLERLLAEIYRAAGE